MPTKTVLLIGDNQDDTLSLSKILFMNIECSVIITHSIELALESLEKNKFDLVILNGKVLPEYDDFIAGIGNKNNSTSIIFISKQSPLDIVDLTNSNNYGVATSFEKYIHIRFDKFIKKVNEFIQ